MSSKVASWVFLCGAATAADPGMVPAASPAAVAIPPLKKVLLEISCPNYDLLSGSKQCE
jgi:hypothetical protein